MNETTIVERVARALAKYDFGDSQPDIWRKYLGDARVALETLREPSKDMLEMSGACDQTHMREVWQRMINAALEQE